MAKAGFRAADSMTGYSIIWKDRAADMIRAFSGSDISLQGAFALEQGSIFTAMIFAAVTVCVIEKTFFRASLWCLAGAGLSVLGLVHSFTWDAKDSTLAFMEPAGKWALAYVIMACVFAAARWVTEDIKPVSDT